MKLKSLIVGIIIITATVWGAPQEGYSYSFTVVQCQVQQVKTQKEEKENSSLKRKEREKEKRKTRGKEPFRDTAFKKGAPTRASP